MKIGTRPSKLALWQSEYVRNYLGDKFGISTSLVKITTKGDRVLDRSLVDIGGKGLFLKEIEDALLAGSVDFAVHSLKDVPYQLPNNLVLAAVLPREDHRDAWITHGARTPGEMPSGSVVGTTSLRRKIQLQKKYPHLKFKDLRGNVDTRLRKLDEHEFDAIVLAMAGLKRLGWEGRITQPLDELISAAGQGAIAIECRKDDVRTLDILSQLNHEETRRCVEIERSFLQKVDGSCQTPVGCHVKRVNADEFFISCFRSDPDGNKYKEFSEQANWSASNDVLIRAVSAVL